MLNKIIDQINDDAETLGVMLSETPEVKDYNDVAYLQFFSGRLQADLRILKMFDESKYNELHEQPEELIHEATRRVYGRKTA